MRRILLTGGAGYIGSVLVEELLKTGMYEVTVLDNFLYGQNSLLNLCFDKNLKIVKGDVRNKTLLLTQMQKADIIIPLAAIVGMPACKQNPELATAVNFEAIKFIANNKSHDQLLLYPNTNSGYGIGKDDLFCTEQTELLPVSLYGTTKVDAEKAVLSVTNSMAFRLATVFGVSARMRLDLLVNEFTWRAYNDGFIVLYEAHYKRNYIHIRDVARAFMWAIDNWKKVNGDVFNLGLSNANLSKLELCQKIQQFVPNFHIDKAEVHKDPDQRNYIVSNEKIEKCGFSQAYSIEDGIEELLKAFPLLNNNKYTNL
jgi:nucleoside-diphosphate-sugar epimerase